MENKPDNSQNLITGVMFFVLALSIILITPQGLSFGLSMAIILGLTILAGYLTAVATKQDDTE